MLLEALKERINALDPSPNIRAWAAIRDITQAMAAAKELGRLALDYVVAAENKKVAQALIMQQTRIAHLENENRNALECNDVLLARVNALGENLAKAQRKLKRAKAKNKK